MQKLSYVAYLLLFEIITNKRVFIPQTSKMPFR